MKRVTAELSRCSKCFNFIVYVESEHDAGSFRPRISLHRPKEVWFSLPIHTSLMLMGTVLIDDKETTGNCVFHSSVHIDTNKILKVGL